MHDLINDVAQFVRREIWHLFSLLEKYALCMLKYFLTYEYEEK